MERQFRIAGISILLNIENIKIDKSWDKFVIYETKEKPDICVAIVYQSQEQYYSIEKYSLQEISNPLLFRTGNDIMLVSNSWNYSKILLLDDVSNMYVFLAQIFNSYVLKTQIIQFHSSLIKTNRKGLMFLGPSGIGKTTQAELWNKYRNALIINGDMVFVQETPDAFLGWGTPWHGSSPYCENTSVPLKAMIVLKQSPENSIRELTGFEKVTAVSNNVFYPRWLENGMELCLETLDHFLSRIPVYELSCRPDEEAVKLTEETIFGSSSVSD